MYLVVLFVHLVEIIKRYNYCLFLFSLRDWPSFCISIKRSAWGNGRGKRWSISIKKYKRSKAVRCISATQNPWLRQWARRKNCPVNTVVCFKRIWYDVTNALVDKNFCFVSGAVVRRFVNTRAISKQKNICLKTQISTEKLASKIPEYVSVDVFYDFTI